jgi:hypothetical protein
MILLEIVAPRRIDIELGRNIRERGLESFRIFVAVDPRQRRIDVEIVPVGRGAKDALDGRIKEPAIAEITGHQQLVAALRQPAQKINGQHQEREDHDGCGRFPRR